MKILTFFDSLPKSQKSNCGIFVVRIFKLNDFCDCSWDNERIYHVHPILTNRLFHRKRKGRRQSSAGWPSRPSAPENRTKNPAAPPPLRDWSKSTSAKSSSISDLDPCFRCRRLHLIDRRKTNCRLRNGSRRLRTSASRRSRCHRAGCRSITCLSPSSTRSPFA